MLADEPSENECLSRHHGDDVRRFTLLVLACMLVFGMAIVLVLGIDATPYETADSAGRTMGFNDPLSVEHYAIIIRNFHVADFFRPKHTYDWLLLAMQAIGAGLLLTAPRVSRRLLRWFFGGQLVLFPLGLVLWWLPPLMALMLIRSPMDREGFTDLPFILIVSQSTWVLASLFIFFALPHEGSEKVRRGLVEGFRSARRRWAD